MIRWLYTTMMWDFSVDPEDILCQMGADGWEVIAAIESVGRIMFILKRPMQDFEHADVLKENRP